MKKKICFFAHDNNLTGANRSMIDLIEQMQHTTGEYSFIVVIPKKGILEKELEIRKINYKIIKSYKLINNRDDNPFKKIVKTMIKQVLNIPAKYKICNFLKNEEINLVHVNSTLCTIGGQCSKSINIPYIYHLREFLAEDHNIEFGQPNKMNKILLCSEKCIGISDIIVDYYKKKYKLNNIIKIYNGISKKECYFSRESVSDVMDIVVVGRLANGKNQLLVLEAYKVLKEEQVSNIGDLYIIGSTGGIEENVKYKKKLKDYVLTNNLQQTVKFISHTNQVLNYRKSTDIAIVPSSLEAFGRVTVEGMLAQQVVIASNSGANTEIVKNDKGILFESGNSKDLATKIKEISKLSKSEILEIQKRACQYAITTFPIDNTAKGILSIYNDFFMDN